MQRLNTVLLVVLIALAAGIWDTVRETRFDIQNAFNRTQQMEAKIDADTNQAINFAVMCASQTAK